MKPLELDGKKSRSSDCWTDMTTPKFVICIENSEYPASLDRAIRKLLAERLAQSCGHEQLGPVLCWVSQTYLAVGTADRGMLRRALNSIESEGEAAVPFIDSVTQHWNGELLVNIAGEDSRQIESDLREALQRGGQATARIIHALL